MYSLPTGTIVPKSTDSPDLPPNFKVGDRKKHPPVSVTLTYVDFSMWHIQIQRLGQLPRNYYYAPNETDAYPKQISMASLLRFHLLFANLTVQEKVIIWPQLTGWMAFIDPEKFAVRTAGFAVYPPPSVSDDEPSSSDEIMATFEQLAKGKEMQDV